MKKHFALTLQTKIRHLANRYVWIVFLVPTLVRSQTDPPIASTRLGFPSPTAASLGKFADIPVSEYTGIPSVDIPLTNVRGRSLNLPVSLRYHAGGIKVGELAGWVGLGWALDAGGVITRTVRGLPDDEPKGYLFRGYQLNTQWPTPTTQYHDAVRDGFEDPEPDQFFFSFAEKSGRFAIRNYAQDQYEIVPVPHQKIKIVPEFGNLPPNGYPRITKWTITTEDGTRYIFGGSQGYDVTHPINQETKMYISSWYLTRVEAVDGSDAIDLEYVQTIAMNLLSTSYEYKVNWASGPPDFGVVYNELVILPNRLRRITSAKDTLLFDISVRDDARSYLSGMPQQEYKLDSVTVGTMQSYRQKLFFDYSYFSGSEPRLRLDSVRVVGSDRSQIPAYKFIYNNSISLPYRNSYSVDHWGFFNNKPNAGLIPAIGSYSGANREIDTAFIQMGILRKITYPTGGYTEFTYEPNEFGKIGKRVNNADHAYAGSGSQLREPFSIANTLDAANVSITSTFIIELGYEPTGPQYVQVETAGGQVLYTTTVNTSTNLLLQPGDYVLVAQSGGVGCESDIDASWVIQPFAPTALETFGGGVRIKRIDSYDGMGGAKTVRKYEYTLSSVPGRSSGVLLAEPVYDFQAPNYYYRSSITRDVLGSTQGSPVGYREVVERIGETGEFGFKRYTFLSPAERTDSVYAYNTTVPPFSSPTSYDWRRGLPVLEESFTNAGVIQKKTAYTYLFKDDVNEPVTTKKVRAVNFFFTLVMTFFHEYEVISAWYHPASTITTTYDQNGQNPVTSTANYFYENPNHIQITKLEETNSDGTVRITEPRYAQEQYTLMTSLNMFKQVYSTTVKKGSADVESKNWIVWDNQWGSGGVYWRPKEEWVWRGDGSANDLNAPPDPGVPETYKLATYESYDGFGHLLSALDANNNRTKYYYGSNTDPFNNNAAGLNNAYLTGIERWLTGSTYLRTSAKYNNSGNVTEIKDEDNGDASTFEYDNFSRLKSTFSPGALRTAGYAYNLVGTAISNSNPNSVVNTLFRSAADSTTTKTFVDGLGYDIQKQITLGSNDIISHTTYDAMRRAQKTYKPYLWPAGHSYDPNFHPNSKTYYTNLGVSIGDYPYSETKYLNDPANRVQEQAFPGATFSVGSGHTVRQEYWTDGANNWLKDRTIDENAKITDAYLDRFGQTVRTVSDVGGLNLQTNFLYDVLGNLTRSTDPRTLQTNYSYTPLKQVRQKISPDAGTTDQFFDRNGNLRLVKDANHQGYETQVTYGPGTGTVYDAFYSTGYRNGSFTTTGGNVTVDLTISGSQNWADYIEIFIRDGGSNVVHYQYTDASNPYSSGSVFLAEGTYSYEVAGVEIDGLGFASFEFILNYPTIVPIYTNIYKFVYNKYYGFNRLVETGEHSSTNSGYFNQNQADDQNFPTSDKTIAKSLIYDDASADALVIGQQRNLKGRLSYASSYRLGALALTTFYSYDDFGRVEWVWHKNLAGSSKKIAYEYDRQGNVTKKSYIDAASSSNNLYTFYEYDLAGRLNKIYTGTNPDGTGKVKEAEYIYQASGNVAALVLGALPAQTVSYSYNSRDWLKQISSSKLLMDFGYNDSIPSPGGLVWTQTQYNGNIRWMTYSMDGVTFNGWGLVGYSFGYDGANRLLAANFGFNGTVGTWFYSSSFNEKDFVYDLSGNISSMKRYGADGNQMDVLTYTYAPSTNKLRHVDDTVPIGQYNLIDIDDQSPDNYTYDANGNMKTDAAKGITLTKYDLDNMPIQITKSGSTYNYHYDISGRRFRKDETSTEYYVLGADGKIEVILNSNGTQATHNIDGIGQVRRNGSTWTRYYYLKDHLGSNRMILNSSGSTDSYTDYYPFGKIMEGRNSESSADARFKFTGHEWQGSLLGYSAEARTYLPDIGRWFTADPLQQKSPSLTPFHYSRSNPVNYLDSDGLEEKAARDYAVLNLVGLRYGTSLKYDKKRFPEWSVERPDFATCNDIVARAYKDGAGYLDFPIPMDDQVDWFRKRGWFSDNQTFQTSMIRGEVGDILFWGDVKTVNRRHAVIITEVVVEGGVVKYRVLGARDEDYPSWERPDLRTFDELQRLWPTKPFHGIGSVKKSIASTPVEKATETESTLDKIADYFRGLGIKVTVY